MVNNQEPAQIMRLMDIQEDVPPPPPPPPPPPRAVEPQQNMVEAISQNMIETDHVPEEQIVVDFMAAPPAPPTVYVPSETIDYIPQSRVSKVPVFSEQDLRRIMTYLRDQYPPIALRSGIEGTVILELFIDSHGVIRQINIFRETPEGRGFGEVAVSAFRDVRASPAEANGSPVAVRYRYPIRFTVR